MIEDVTITTSDQNQVTLPAYPAGSVLPTNPGVYIFLSKTGFNWRILYVGESVNLNQRSGSGLSTHEKLNGARSLGITHIAVLALHPTQTAARFRIEKQLCADFQPPLNIRLVA